MLKKIILCALFAFGFQPLYATETTDKTDRLMDWAEATFYELFSPGGQTSQTIVIDDPNSPFIGEWYYRFYPQTGDFIALKNKTDIYLLGGIFGDQPTRVDSLDNLLQNVPKEGNCNNVPLPTAGQVAEYDINDIAENLKGTLIATIKESTSTKLVIEQSIIGENKTVKTTETSTFKIIDNFLFETKNVTVSNQTGFNISSTLSYEPDILRGPRLVYCQGTDWQATKSVATATLTPSLGTARPEDAPLSRGKVNAIEIDLNTAAGTFKTVKETIYDDDGERTERWISIDNGLVILERVTNKDNTLSSIQILKLIR